MIDEATAQLIGVWKVIEFADRPDPASEWESYGPDPQGIIVYDRTGTISVHLISEGPLPSTKGYLGYWGTFLVREAERRADGFVGTLEHHMDGGSMSELFEEGADRPFTLHADTLVIGDQTTARRVLERVR